MALRCWPGCLAYVTDADDPRTLGALVEVVERAPAEAEQGYGPTWVVRSAAPLHVLDAFDSEPCVDTTALAPDVALRPITPPPAAKTTDAPAELEAA